MNKARSIKQNTLPDALPNFRNLGIILRILLISNALAILQALLLANSWTDVGQQTAQIATLLTPVLLTTLLLLWISQPLLDRLEYWQGTLFVMSSASGLTLVFFELGSRSLDLPGRPGLYFDEARYILLCLTVCSILLLYFRVRAQILSRALHDARLQVLRARIRPHFLFNTLNAVLGIVRSQPKRAETALEDMADLFRMAMSDARDLVPLQREIQLCRQYIALEQLRMGDRLSVDWQIQDVPEDALIPPLLLQPLLENAVYHGIEPLPQGGHIRVILQRSDDKLRLRMENPCVVRDAGKPDYVSDIEMELHGNPQSARTPEGKLQRSNKIALQNIRDRLELLFDAEAHYQSEYGLDYYRVEIILPYINRRPEFRGQTA